jgi:hypothetical protein
MPPRRIFFLLMLTTVLLDTCWFVPSRPKFHQRRRSASSGFSSPPTRALLAVWSGSARREQACDRGMQRRSAQRHPVGSSSEWSSISCLGHPAQRLCRMANVSRWCPAWAGIAVRRVDRGQQSEICRWSSSPFVRMAELTGHDSTPDRVPRNDDWPTASRGVAMTDMPSQARWCWPAGTASRGLGSPS